MLGSRLLLSTALFAAVDTVTAEDARSCNDSIISIVNQTDIDFYKTCPTINGALFFIDHQFKGPFELSGVESLPEVSSGYLGPKFSGYDRVDDGVTTVSMPDLKNVTGGGLLFGYLDNLTSISFPKLETVTGYIVVMGSYGVHNITLPALSTVDGGVILDGDFDQINLPSLKSLSYLRVLSTGNISCLALGASFASLKFTPKKTDLYTGFTCWTGYENNRWNSSDPEHNPTAGGSKSSSATHLQSGTETIARVGYLVIMLVSIGMLCL